MIRTRARFWCCWSRADPTKLLNIFPRSRGDDGDDGGEEPMERGFSSDFYQHHHRTSFLHMLKLLPAAVAVPPFPLSSHNVSRRPTGPNTSRTGSESEIWCNLQKMPFYVLQKATAAAFPLPPPPPPPSELTGHGQWLFAVDGGGALDWLGRNCTCPWRALQQVHDL